MLRTKVLFIVLCSLFLVGHAVQPAMAASSPIKISVKEGFNGKVKSGRGFPVQVTIENSGQDFVGDLLFNFSASYNTSGAKVLAIDVPKGSKKTYSVSLPAYSEDYYNSRQIKQTIFLYKGSWKDHNEQGFVGDKILKPKIIDPEGQTVGMLSEDADRLKELKALPASSVEPLVLSEEMVPENELGLNSLDYLLIDEFSIAKLKKPQQDAILKWVQNGGHLIVGAAPNAAAAYGSLTPILPMKADQEVLADTKFFQTGGKKPPMRQIPFFIGKIDKQADIVIKSGDLPAVVHKGYGAGEIWQTAFSLGDEPLSSWNGYGQWFADRLIVSGSAKLQSQNGNSNPYEMLFSEFAEVNEYFTSAHFSLGQISLMLVIYLLLIAPFLYVLLKRLDKREHAWWVILGLAVISSAGIFAIGAKDRIAKPQLNQMGIYKAENNQLTGYEAVSFLSNTGGNYVVDFSNGDFHGVPGDSLTTVNDGRRFAVLENGRKSSSVTFPNVEYWSNRTYFGQAAKQNIGGFENNLIYKNKKLTGEIVNHFPYDFEELYIWSGTNKINLGLLKSGESLKVNQTLQQDYLARPYTSGNNYSTPNSNQDLNKLKRQKMEFSAIEYLYSNSQTKEKPILFGYTKSSVIKADIKGKHEVRKPLTLIYQTLDLEPNFTGSFTIKHDLLRSEIKPIRGAVLSEWERGAANTRLELDDGEYDYSLELPKSLREKSLRLHELKITWYGRNVSYSLLNHKSGQYIPLSNNHTLIQKDVDQFISSEGTILIKMVKSGQGDPEIKMPSLSLKGEINP